MEVFSINYIQDLCVPVSTVNNNKLIKKNKNKKIIIIIIIIILCYRPSDRVKIDRQDIFN